MRALEFQCPLKFRCQTRDIIPTKRNQVKKRENSSQKPHKYDILNFSASPQKEKRIISFHPALAEKQKTKKGNGTC